ncbi:MAG: low-specificity L-threonine aldolase [Bacteroidetes bacterium]|nr:low-specificity L-threonine aldolase [Bacteroidota bacterium]
MKYYDMRSDTLTKPAAAMREAIMSAEVGDDVYHEDPTINELEKRAAELTGKEAALYVTSGSMGNLLALYINCGRGNEVLAHRNSHIIEHEVGSPAAIAGVLPIGLDGERGLLDPSEIEKHLFPRDYAMASVGMIEVENTTNGTCYPLQTLKEIAALAAKHSIPIHMDGARLMNAVTALDVPVKDICRFADTVSFCLSKGLGAPVGSMLCGSSEFILKARKVRKMLGGGMRQAGILAAAGLYALDNNIKRLADDHNNAAKISEALASVSWADIDPNMVDTNIIIFNTPGTNAELIVEKLKTAGILCFSVDPDAIRMVTHLDISNEDADEICRIIRELD